MGSCSLSSTHSRSRSVLRTRLLKLEKNKPVEGAVRPDAALKKWAIFESKYSRLEEERDNVSKAKNKLNRINALFDVCIDVQRRLMYLEGIFSGSADIKTLLPVETSRFMPMLNSIMVLSILVLEKSWFKIHSMTGKDWFLWILRNFLWPEIWNLNDIYFLILVCQNNEVCC